jgi:NAD(P)-dependent dehydrogenase (short-subunit alcohol dehydrogenase family)
VDAVLARFVRLDILVNNAGINVKSPAIEQTRAKFEPVIEVNLIGLLICWQAAARVMIQQRSGSIINMASMAGLATLGRGNNFYAATKGAVISLTRELALEWAPHQIRVNAIASRVVCNRTDTTQLSGTTRYASACRRGNAARKDG